MKNKKVLRLKDFIFKKQNWTPDMTKKKLDLKLIDPVKVRTNCKSL